MTHHRDRSACPKRLFAIEPTLRSETAAADRADMAQAATTGFSAELGAGAASESCAIQRVKPSAPAYTTRLRQMGGCREFEHLV
eukprot:CAMPEP_0181223820 /NCGR_PEP_ID=MMETSP1096-20121128/30764_1 /TAXON_ID=156174 ORGANISM="Chrysochromulina ericina, Strain CCMP281" /NCGR_SAMPLE_ID=MMETSP1096 /ASSEMBLY_ACC=CAM_ASM_000453 /LENGTH=83 /DNA_ID=CAMNT_0023316795 /DNA_START=71 /DNA_END=323 /DNA_ORIENTATION=+